MLKILLIFILLNIVNWIFLYNKNKFEKITLILTGISIIFSVTAILLINLHYNGLVTKEFSDAIQSKIWYFETMQNLNCSFGITSFILTSVLALLSVKINYKIVYIINLISLLILTNVLFLEKCIIITKSNIDLGSFACSLMIYYLSFSIIPLTLKKCANVTK